MNSEIKTELEKIAYQKSNPFCYHCYSSAPTGRCTTCLSDDLMREVKGVGVECGVDWVIDHILKTELTPANLEEAFEQSICDCYPETTKVAWCEFDTVTLLKENDPISWRCALSEYESNEESEGNIISFDGGSNYYLANDIENLINNLEYVKEDE